MSYADVTATVAIVMSGLTLSVQTYQWLKNRESERIKRAEEKEWEQIKFARELTDEIIARQDRLDDYLENVSNGKTQHRYERHIDRINNVLRECEYFGSLDLSEMYPIQRILR